MAAINDAPEDRKHTLTAFDPTPAADHVRVVREALTYIRRSTGSYQDHCNRARAAIPALDAIEAEMASAETNLRSMHTDLMEAMRGRSAAEAALRETKWSIIGVHGKEPPGRLAVALTIIDGYFNTALAPQGAAPPAGDTAPAGDAP